MHVLTSQIYKVPSLVLYFINSRHTTRPIAHSLVLLAYPALPAMTYDSSSRVNVVS